VLAAVLLGQVPGAHVLLGGALILVAVVAAGWRDDAAAI
jgi:hypothetical protein